MMFKIAIAFCTAAGVTIVLTPLCRRVALASGFVDRPGPHKSHHRPVPYLGGAAVCIGALIGELVAGRGASPLLGLVAFGSAALAVTGLLDDDRTLSARTRLGAQVVVTGAVVGFGVDLEILPVGPIDAALTLVWIMAMTNAINFLDNMDGLAAGLAGAISLTILLATGDGGFILVPVVAASVAGAVVGFLPWNIGPASIYLGDTGSLFLGFTLATLSVATRPELATRAQSVTAVLFLAVPILDIVTVCGARLRRGISVTQGGRNHLSHRLVALGLSKGAAVGVLIGVQLVVGILAASIGRGGIDVTTGVIWALLALGSLAVIAGRASVFPEAPLPLSALLPLAVGRRLTGVSRPAWPERAGELVDPGTLSSPPCTAPGHEPAAAGTER